MTMKSRIVAYGKGGDPLMKADDGRIIVLHNYDTLPDIGSEVEYSITGTAKNVIFADMVYPGRLSSGGKAADDVLKKIGEIRGYWDSFATAADPCVQEAFPQHLKDVEGNYRKGDYASALSEAEKLQEFSLGIIEVRPEENLQRFKPIATGLAEIMKYLKEKL
jgi:hypothetical protein